MKNINAMDILLAFQQIIVNKWRQLRHKNQYKKIVIATLLYLNVACFFICLLSILIIKVKSTIGFVESYLNLLCDDWRCKVHSLIRTSSKSYKFFNTWNFIIIYTKNHLHQDDINPVDAFLWLMPPIVLPWWIVFYIILC